MTTKSKQKTAKPAATTDIDWTATFIEAVNSPGSLGNTYCRFYNYSFLNQIRLMMQGCMEPVATYKRWLELGYQVQKGSRAKAVLAPMIVTKKDDAGKPIFKNGKPQTILIGFRESRTVFGFSDTDGDELPLVTLPKWDTATALKTLGVKREKFKHTDGNAQGYSYEHDTKGQFIAINPTAVYPAKTLLHELAHLVLGHCKDQDNYETHRGIREFEAESVAYLVAKELELKDWSPEESRAYIMHWLEQDGHDPDGSNGDAYTDKNISRIFAAANKILVAGREVSES